MINMSAIMALSESGTGFVGGACVDVMPHLSLTEAVTMLPVAIVESQIEFEEADQKMNDRLVESVIMAAQTGSSIDADALVEMSFADIKAKIKAFFKKIIDFLKSIIAKLKMHIDKLTLSGKQLYDRYKDSKFIKGKDFKDLTYNGYEFSKDLAGKYKGQINKYSDESSIDDLVKIGLKGDSQFKKPAEFARFGVSSSDNEFPADKKTEAEETIESIKEVSAEDRKLNMLKELTGLNNLSEGSWRDDIKEDLYGSLEKKEIKYGEGGFTLDSIGNYFKEPTDLKRLHDDYTKIKTACEKKQRSLEKDLDKYGKDAKGDAMNTALSLATSYYNSYISAISNALDVINVIQGMKYDALKARDAQYKSMFGKMLSYKSKSDNNDAATLFGSEDVYELDLMD